MHLETLRLYCDVVRLRSFSRGAEQSFVSQSAASQAVQQLEALARCGPHRSDQATRSWSRRRARPSTARARGCSRRWEKAKSEVAAVKERVAGTVKVAAIYSVGLHDVSRHMQRFMSLYPEARVQLECLHPHKVVEAVLSGDVDVGIMSYPPADRALSVVTLRSEPMVFVCHPQSPAGPAAAGGSCRAERGELRGLRSRS